MQNAYLLDFLYERQVICKLAGILPGTVSPIKKENHRLGLYLSSRVCMSEALGLIFPLPPTAKKQKNRVENDKSSQQSSLEEGTLPRGI
jgi:hypothetical protein